MYVLQGIINLLADFKQENEEHTATSVSTRFPFEYLKIKILIVFHFVIYFITVLLVLVKYEFVPLDRGRQTAARGHIQNFA